MARGTQPRLPRATDGAVSGKAWAEAAHGGHESRRRRQNPGSVQAAGSSGRHPWESPRPPTDGRPPEEAGEEKRGGISTGREWEAGGRGASGERKKDDEEYETRLSARSVQRSPIAGRRRAARGAPAEKLYRAATFAAPGVPVAPGAL
ncbi:unnamed protein product [Prorocentrum cordatum]|uniref:Uncharacterized protein n=1 Tax=Prorocentrum cordatum TaxID=2364126 RepID=A0ABN9V8I6_9DINO|nr:unnamed protein product [Polarella glacialis]